MLDKLQDLFTNCWEKGALQEDLKDAVFVSLCTKNKGENQTVQSTEASLG